MIGGGRGGPAAGLIGGRLGLRSGSLGGDVNATALAVLALAERRPRAAARAARWLASVQDASGGFGFRPGVAPDVDTTGLAGWALARESRPAAVRRAAAFVVAAQAADGGFPSLPGGASNAQSTGLALVALRVAGVGPRPVGDRPHAARLLGVAGPLQRLDPLPPRLQPNPGLDHRAGTAGPDGQGEAARPIRIPSQHNDLRWRPT